MKIDFRIFVIKFFKSQIISDLTNCIGIINASCKSIYDKKKIQIFFADIIYTKLYTWIYNIPFDCSKKYQNYSLQHSWWQWYGDAGITIETVTDSTRCTPFYTLMESFLTALHLTETNYKPVDISYIYADRICTPR